MKVLARILSGLMTVAFLGLGLLFIFNPAATLNLLQLTPEAPDGWAAIRSVFGGLFLGIALLLIHGLVHSEGLPIRMAGVVLAATVLGRVVSLAADGFEAHLLRPILIEAVLVAICFFSAKQFSESEA